MMPPAITPPVRRLRPPGNYFNFPIHFSVFAIMMAVFMKTALHQVPEGHVGIYWRGGKLLQRITGPGIHSRFPILDTYEAIQVTMQTDKVMDIPCGTKGGVNITFEKIEVVNRLKRDSVYETIREYGVNYDKTWIYDKIHHEINQFCSSHTLQEVYIDKFDQVDEKIREALQVDCNRYAPGVEIISVRVTKPTIPASIMANYVAMEVERTQAMVAVERQRVMQREVEAERARAVALAQSAAETSHIRMQQLLSENDISNQIYLARQKAWADADAYKLEREAAANERKLTPQFLELSFINALANNTKIFFGDRIPNLVLDQRLVTGIFDGLQGQSGASGGRHCHSHSHSRHHGRGRGRVRGGSRSGSLMGDVEEEEQQGDEQEQELPGSWQEPEEQGQDGSDLWAEEDAG